MLKYKYQETGKIKKLLVEIEAFKLLFGQIKAGKTRGVTYKARGRNSD